MSDLGERRAPVNGSPHGTIAWAEHVEAWEAYARCFSFSQNAEGIAERGGFGIAELTYLLGGLPRTWRPDNRTRFMRGVKPRDELAQVRAEDAPAVLRDIEAVFPECYLLRSSYFTCIDLIGGTFPNGAVFTAKVACDSCKIRAVLDRYGGGGGDAATP